MIISLIAGIGRNNELGLANQMLWHISADFKHFKTTTMGHHMIMGRKTYDSIGKPLPGRTTIVLTRSDDFQVEGVKKAHSVEQALAMAQAAGEGEVFIVGGAQIYEQYLPQAHKLYLSRIDFEGEADTFFPSVDFSQWRCQSRQEHPALEHSPAWTLEVWTRR